MRILVTGASGRIGRMLVAALVERGHEVKALVMQNDPNAGKLAAMGTVDEVKGVFAGRPIIEVRAEKPVQAMAALDEMPDVEKTSLFGTAVHAVLRSRALSPDDIRSRLAAKGIPIQTISTVTPSLEDVFLDVVDRAARNAPGGTAA